jgi:phage repressor protein C with HTH and peptisase S24 domain
MQEKSLIKKNILKFIDTKGISKYAFYKRTGITRGILDQNNGMSEENTAKFLAVFGNEISINWLIRGIGNYDLSASQDTLLQKSKISEYGIKIPLVSVTAVGGFGNAKFAIKESDVKEYYVIPKFKDRKIDFMIEIYGSSMQPKYNSGDIIACTIIKESQFIQWNKVHIISTTEQGILVKRLRKGSSPDLLLAVSDNKDYDPFEIPVNEIIGLAIVVGIVRLE